MSKVTEHTGERLWPWAMKRLDAHLERTGKTLPAEVAAALAAHQGGLMGVQPDKPQTDEPRAGNRKSQ